MLSIRTQNRMALVPYNNLIRIRGIVIGGEKDVEFRCFMEFDSESFELGTYPTKERALEVLDEIEAASMGRLVIPEPLIEEHHWAFKNRTIIQPIGQNKIEILPFVYQMPPQ
jgi:hypothetical protein